MKTKLFLTGLALMAVTVLANAQNPSPCKGNGHGQCVRNCKGSAFVDKNNDGICDNKGNATANAMGNKRTGNGECNGSGRRQGQGNGRNFVDANKDGVCDNNKTGSKK
jgi:hypothetical protein